MTDTPKEPIVVRHIDTQDTIAWSDGHFAGPSHDLKDTARDLYDHQATVTLPNGERRKIEHNAEGATLAMVLACGGRGRIISTNHGALPSDTKLM